MFLHCRRSSFNAGILFTPSVISSRCRECEQQCWKYFSKRLVLSITDAPSCVVNISLSFRLSGVRPRSLSSAALCPLIPGASCGHCLQDRVTTIDDQLSAITEARIPRKCRALCSSDQPSNMRHNVRTDSNKSVTLVFMLVYTLGSVVKCSVSEDGRVISLGADEQKLHEMHEYQPWKKGKLSIASHISRSSLRVEPDVTDWRLPLPAKLSFCWKCWSLIAEPLPLDNEILCVSKRWRIITVVAVDRLWFVILVNGIVWNDLGALACELAIPAWNFTKQCWH